MQPSEVATPIPPVADVVVNIDGGTVAIPSPAQPISMKAPLESRAPHPDMKVTPQRMYMQTPAGRR